MAEDGRQWDPWWGKQWVRWLRGLLLPITLAAGATVAAPLAVAGAAASWAYALRCEGWRGGLAATVNLPWDLLVYFLGWWQCLGTVTVYWGTAEQPGAGWLRGSVCFRGGAMGHLVSTFAHALTLSSAFFISGAAWRRRTPEQRDELVNHELWHVRHHLRRYTFLWFWPSYLYCNVRFGIHRRNPWETGPMGPYLWVTDRWEAFKTGPEHVNGRSPYWF